MKGEFYKMEYEAWDEGTDQLTLEQEGAYLRFCHQMYRRKGPVLDDERVLARLWKCHPNKVRKLRSDLIEAGKIFATGDGHLSNTRVTQELDTRETTRTQRAHAGHIGGTRSGQNRRNSLKTQDADEALASSKTNQRREEERREEKKEEPLSFPFAVAAPIGAAQPRTSARGSRLPQDWKLDTAGRAYATDRGFNGPQIDRMAERFANHWHSKTGKDACKMDWQATWRNWVLNEVERSPPTAQKTVWAQTA